MTLKVPDVEILVYEGQFANDQYQGKGKFKRVSIRPQMTKFNYSEPIIIEDYTGDFHQGKKEGKGTQKYLKDVDELMKDTSEVKD